MKKLFYILTLSLGVLAVSCNKDQAAVKKLDGTWTITSLVSTGGGVSFDFIALGGTGTMMFDGCKLKTDEWCSMTSTTTFGGLTDTEIDVYRVTGDGVTLESKDSDTSTTVSKMTIVDLTKTACELTQVDGTETTTVKLTKN